MGNNGGALGTVVEMALHYTHPLSGSIRSLRRPSCDGRNSELVRWVCRAGGDSCSQVILREQQFLRPSATGCTYILQRFPTVAVIWTSISSLASRVSLP